MDGPAVPKLFMAPKTGPWWSLHSVDKPGCLQSRNTNPVDPRFQAFTSHLTGNLEAVFRLWSFRNCPSDYTTSQLHSSKSAQTRWFWPGTQGSGDEQRLDSRDESQNGCDHGRSHWSVKPWRNPSLELRQSLVDLAPLGGKATKRSAKPKIRGSKIINSDRLWSIQNQQISDVFYVLDNRLPEELSGHTWGCIPQ